MHGPGGPIEVEIRSPGPAPATPLREVEPPAGGPEVLPAPGSVAGPEVVPTPGVGEAVRLAGDEIVPLPAGPEVPAEPLPASRPDRTAGPDSSARPGGAVSGGDRDALLAAVARTLPGGPPGYLLPVRLQGPSGAGYDVRVSPARAGAGPAPASGGGGSAGTGVDRRKEFAEWLEKLRADSPELARRVDERLEERGGGIGNLELAVAEVEAELRRELAAAMRSVGAIAAEAVDAGLFRGDLTAADPAGVQALARSLLASAAEAANLGRYVTVEPIDDMPGYFQLTAGGRSARRRFTIRVGVFAAELPAVRGLPPAARGSRVTPPDGSTLWVIEVHQRIGAHNRDGIERALAHELSELSALSRGEAAEDAHAEGRLTELDRLVRRLRAGEGQLTTGEQRWRYARDVFEFAALVKEIWPGSRGFGWYLARSADRAALKATLWRYLTSRRRGPGWVADVWRDSQRVTRAVSAAAAYRQRAGLKSVAGDPEVLAALQAEQRRTATVRAAIDEALAGAGALGLAASWDGDPGGGLVTVHPTDPTQRRRPPGAGTGGAPDGPAASLLDVSELVAHLAGLADEGLPPDALAAVALAGLGEAGYTEFPDAVAAHTKGLVASRAMAVAWTLRQALAGVRRTSRSRTGGRIDRANALAQAVARAAVEVAAESLAGPPGEGFLAHTIDAAGLATGSVFVVPYSDRAGGVGRAELVDVRPVIAAVAPRAAAGVALTSLIAAAAEQLGAYLGARYGPGPATRGVAGPDPSGPVDPADLGALTALGRLHAGTTDPGLRAKAVRAAERRLAGRPIGDPAGSDRMRAALPPAAFQLWEQAVGLGAGPLPAAGGDPRGGVPPVPGPTGGSGAPGAAPARPAGAIRDRWPRRGRAADRPRPARRLIWPIERASDPGQPALPGETWTTDQLRGWLTEYEGLLADAKAAVQADQLGSHVRDYVRKVLAFAHGLTELQDQLIDRAAEHQLSAVQLTGTGSTVPGRRSREAQLRVIEGQIDYHLYRAGQLLNQFDQVRELIRTAREWGRTSPLPGVPPHLVEQVDRLFGDLSEAPRATVLDAIVLYGWFKLHEMEDIVELGIEGVQERQQREKTRAVDDERLLAARIQDEEKRLAGIDRSLQRELATPAAPDDAAAAADRIAELKRRQDDSRDRLERLHQKHATVVAGLPAAAAARERLAADGSNQLLPDDHHLVRERRIAELTGELDRVSAQLAGSGDVAELHRLAGRQAELVRRLAELRAAEAAFQHRRSGNAELYRSLYRAARQAQADQAAVQKLTVRLAEAQAGPDASRVRELTWWLNYVPPAQRAALEAEIEQIRAAADPHRLARLRDQQARAAARAEASRHRWEAAAEQVWQAEVDRRAPLTAVADRVEAARGLRAADPDDVRHLHADAERAWSKGARPQPRERLRRLDGFVQNLRALVRLRAQRAAAPAGGGLAEQLDGEIRYLQKFLNGWWREAVDGGVLLIPPPSKHFALDWVRDDLGTPIGPKVPWPVRGPQFDAKVHTPFTSANPLDWAGHSEQTRPPARRHHVKRLTWRLIGGTLPVYTHAESRYVVRPFGSDAVIKVTVEDDFRYAALQSPTGMLRFGGAAGPYVGSHFPPNQPIRFPISNHFRFTVIPRAFTGAEVGLLLPGSDDVYADVGKARYVSDLVSGEWPFDNHDVLVEPERRELLRALSGPRLAPQRQFNTGVGLLGFLELHSGGRDDPHSVQYAAIGAVMQWQVSLEIKGHRSAAAGATGADLVRLLRRGLAEPEYGLSAERVIAGWASIGAGLWVPQPGEVLPGYFGSAGVSGVGFSRVKGRALDPGGAQIERSLGRIPLVGRRLRRSYEDATDAFTAGREEEQRAAADQAAATEQRMADWRRLGAGAPRSGSPPAGRVVVIYGPGGQPLRTVVLRPNQHPPASGSTQSGPPAADPPDKPAPGGG
ncbi:MAG TPA: hypothetical protein VMU51_32895 [Mycobacteriales bacterium]|nr:hypothetical protein [Mycobacteriales bacterium]